MFTIHTLAAADFNDWNPLWQAYLVFYETHLPDAVTRTSFARHDLDFRAFLREGCDADTLLATGDAMAQRVVEHARNQSSQREQG